MRWGSVWTGAVAHADDLELFGEAFGHTRDHVGHEGTRETVQRPVPALVIGPADQKGVAVLRNGDPFGKTPLERPLRAFHVDRRTTQGDSDT